MTQNPRPVPVTERAHVKSLDELAFHLRWCWGHFEDELRGPLEPELWELTHYRWAVLQTILPFSGVAIPFGLEKEPWAGDKP
ncbi:MAG: hypothetical protein DMG06_25300 [Acidobacteria bacterium]|nr:MAG: hypothetical protein DMG06_25300 [Acidobacteriota bacterium]